MNESKHMEAEVEAIEEEADELEKDEFAKLMDYNTQEINTMANQSEVTRSIPKTYKDDQPVVYHKIKEQIVVDKKGMGGGRIPLFNAELDDNEAKARPAT